MADSLANIFHTPFVSEAAAPTRVIVVADGDVFMNEVTDRGPMPLGFNEANSFTFANKDFVENSLEYLVNPSRILETRSKDYTLRLLDPAKVEDGSFLLAVCKHRPAHSVGGVWRLCVPTDPPPPVYSAIKNPVQSNDLSGSQPPPVENAFAKANL